MAKIIEVIYNEESRGMGVTGDPFRLVPQWFEKNGNLIFEKDPCEDIVNQSKVPEGK